MTDAPLFYVGLHQPSDAGRFDRCCLSLSRIWGRKKPVACPDVLVDSKSFTELALHGRHRTEVKDHARELRRLNDEGVVRIAAAVAQDYMCEPFMLAKTGLTVEEHQRLTIDRYDALVAEALPFPIMPVLQGYDPSDYIRHVAAYGDRLTPGMWVGVGSVCKRNGSPEQVIAVLAAIHAARPDLRLHGFGVKQTSLLHPGVRDLLYSADSMAWSFAARKQGRDGNSWLEADRFVKRITETTARAFEPWQMPLPLLRSAA